MVHEHKHVVVFSFGRDDEVSAIQTVRLQHLHKLIHLAHLFERVEVDREPVCMQAKALTSHLVSQFLRERSKHRRLLLYIIYGPRDRPIFTVDRDVTEHFVVVASRVQKEHFQSLADAQDRPALILLVLHVLGVFKNLVRRPIVLVPLASCLVDHVDGAARQQHAIYLAEYLGEFL